MGQEITWVRALGAGLLAGVLNGIVANLGHVVLGGVMGGLHFAELSPGRIFTVTLVTGLAGAVAWVRIARRTAQPERSFLVLALSVAAASGVPLLLTRTSPGLPRVALPLHFLVALGAWLVIPRASRPVPPAAR